VQTHAKENLAADQRPAIDKEKGEEEGEEERGRG